jgi:hypothetical protein
LLSGPPFVMATCPTGGCRISGASWRERLLTADDWARFVPVATVGAQRSGSAISKSVALIL